jgi:hypothetical protein
MFRKFREPFGKAGLTVAVCALVLAMVGGAYAAGGLTKSQEKQVTKIAKKYAGQPGAPGTNGTNGTSGAIGVKGDSGAPGAPGVDGKSVVASAASGTECTGGVGGTKFEVEGGSPSHVCNGKNGTTGFTETLPPRKSEHGVWNYFDSSGQPNQTLPISFPIWLEKPIPPAKIQVIPVGGTGTVGTGCEGGEIENPIAEPGWFCFYVQQVEGEPVTFFFFNQEVSGLAQGLGKSGGTVNIGGAGQSAEGVWVVTAPEP